MTWSLFLSSQHLLKYLSLFSQFFQLNPKKAQGAVTELFIRLSICQSIYSTDAMDTATLSLLSALPTQRFLSYEKPTPTCYVLPSHNHFLKHFSYTTNLNRNSKFRTPEAVLDTSPITPTALTTPTLRELCQAHVPEHILQRQLEDLSRFFLSFFSFSALC